MIPHLKPGLAASLFAIGAMLHPAAARCQTAPAAQAGPVTTRMDHISITATGSGPAIFLIPGLSSPRAVWDDAVPALAKTHRVYLVQVNGFGGDAPGGNLAAGILAGIVADLDGFVVGNRIAGAKLVGHSMGGWSH